jgi:hypothetical protein
MEAATHGRWVGEDEIGILQLLAFVAESIAKDDGASACGMTLDNPSE